MRALRAWTSRPAFGQLFLAILSFLTVSELILGLAVYARLRRDLESDLGRRLVHAARLLATVIDPSLVLQFRAGDEELPAYELTRARLARQAEAAGVESAYVVDRELRTVLDGRRGAELGATRYALMVNRTEVAAVLQGRATPTRLYRREDGSLRLSALAPLTTARGDVAAVVGVDAPPEFFASLASLRRRMILLGAITLALTALGTLLFLRQTERRLGRLRQAVSRATRGDFATRTEIPGRDPIGALGRDLDGLIASMVGTREYYEAVLGSLEVGLLTTDAAGDIRGANASAQRLLAPGGPALVGGRLADAVAGEAALADFVRSATVADAHPRAAWSWRPTPAASSAVTTLPA
jgi:PAS domain-containing protein